MSMHWAFSSGLLPLGVLHTCFTKPMRHQHKYVRSQWDHRLR